jgi:hypothetical protein
VTRRATASVILWLMDADEENDDREQSFMMMAYAVAARNVET